MFSKLFRRGRGDHKASSKLPKSASFSAQFPPSDWSDPDFVHFHSRATQTLDRDNYRSKSRSSSLNRMSSRERHAHNASSTPVTPRTHHRSHPSTDVYHYRSSSLPRKSTPSPKPDVRRAVENSVSSTRRSSPKATRRHQNRHQPQPASKSNPKCQSIPSPFKPYCKENDITESHDSKVGLHCTPNVPQYRPGTFSLTPFSSFSSRRYMSPSLYQPPWRTVPVGPSTPVAIGEPMKQTTPMVFLPQRTLNREVASISPSKNVLPTNKNTTITPTIKHPTKPITINIKDTRKLDCTSPKSLGSTNEVHLDGSVDVEIRMGNDHLKKGVLNTDLDSEIKKDLLKIATTWNHSISNNKVHVTTSNPTLTTSTSISTSLTHRGLTQEENTNEGVQSPHSTSKLSPISVLAIDGEDPSSPFSDAGSRNLSPSPRSRLAEAKAAFFDTPSPCPDQQLIKDDSGFSSSASTSRPISVSPC